MSEKELMGELQRLVARHADWLDGRTWQRVCLEVAGGYFDPDDLDSIGSMQAWQEELMRALNSDEFKRAMEAELGGIN